MSKKSTYSVSNNIEELRFREKISQQELADRVGCSRYSIQKYESNKAVPSLEIAYKIADYFNVKLEELFIFETQLECVN